MHISLFPNCVQLSQDIRSCNDPIVFWHVYFQPCIHNKILHTSTSTFKYFAEPAVSEHRCQGFRHCRDKTRAHVIHVPPIRTFCKLIQKRSILLCSCFSSSFYLKGSSDNIPPCYDAHLQGAVNVCEQALGKKLKLMTRYY